MFVIYLMAWILRLEVQKGDISLCLENKVSYKNEPFEGISIFTGNLAKLALDRRNWPEAECLASEALALAEGVGHKELIAANHHHLAQALLNQHRANEALPPAQQAVEMGTQLRHRDLAEATLAACQASAI